MSVICLAIWEMFSKAVLDAFIICFIAAPNTSPAIGVATPVFSISPDALWRIVLYWSSMTDVISRCMLAASSYKLREYSISLSTFGRASEAATSLSCCGSLTPISCCAPEVPVLNSSRLAERLSADSCSSP